MHTYTMTEGHVWLKLEYSLCCSVCMITSSRSHCSTDDLCSEQCPSLLPSSTLHPLPLLFFLHFSPLHADDKRTDNEKHGRGLWSRDKKQDEFSSVVSGGKYSTFSDEAQSHGFKMTTVTTHRGK